MPQSHSSTRRRSPPRPDNQLRPVRVRQPPGSDSSAERPVPPPRPVRRDRPAGKPARLLQSTTMPGCPNQRARYSRYCSPLPAESRWSESYTRRLVGPIASQFDFPESGDRQIDDGRFAGPNNHPHRRLQRRAPPCSIRRVIQHPANRRRIRMADLQQGPSFQGRRVGGFDIRADQRELCATGGVFQWQVASRNCVGLVGQTDRQGQEPCHAQQWPRTTGRTDSTQDK